MKRAVLFGGLALVVMALAVLAAGWLLWRGETHEVGLHLPPGARITATRAHIFSLADGNNYEWLIQSDTSLLPWATTNMHVERGGWEHIRYLSELCDFKYEIPQDVKFGGVWKETRRTSRGREETSYLYIADDGRVGILSTFRP